MICAETVRQDCDHLYEKIADSKRKMSIASRNAIPWELNPLQSYRLFSGSTQSQLVDWLCYFGVFARIVTTYSARTLSYDSDILHAFSGLAAALSELKAGGNYFGLPEISFDLALLWVPVGSTIKRRREGESGILGDDVFPSWSWAGWNGEVSYNCCETSGKPQFSDIKITSCVNSFCIINAEGKTCVLKNEPWPGPATPVGRPNLNLLPQFLSDGEFGTNSKDGPNHRPGMLLFWAEEAGPDQLRCVFPSSLEPLPDRENKPQYSYLFTRYGYKQCGIVALMSSQFLKAGDTIEREKYSFVLMSECEKPFSRWFRDEGGTFTVVDDVASRMTSDKEIGRVLNVLLVRQKGDCYERLGCGQVAAQHWMPLKRRRRFFKLI
jgi:phage tail protein X